ncbi:DUF7059 domain-containing protein [Nocardioides coralli]|uniref:DUF7059 domain-containing protein n=1 Tax=Nocardioides coralli TaxID=2872154 RepID=UPI001CA3B96C|nr:methyltransferase [Nocardioides coralli]QZY29385.1 methyltransferase [Nocardioides coralli]
MLSPDLTARLREALAGAGYGFDAVVAQLGATAHEALARNETTPALRRTAGDSPLEGLVRLFLLQAGVDRDAADRALPGLVDPLVAVGMLEEGGGEVRALVDCRPYADDEHDLWVVSDLTPGLDGSDAQVGPDHVLGISPASTSLAQLTVRRPVGRSLDLGTGCGVQALHLATHSDQVIATDVNERALAITRLNCGLNGVANVDVRAGSLLDPLAGERFDLIATNPPFVIGPGTGELLVYRDSGLPGDQVVEQIVRGAPEHLAPGGWLQVLANWAVVEGRPWEERLADWLPADHTALVVQREVLDPTAYVELWLKDAGLHGSVAYRTRYDAWLDWFEEQQIEALGFGWICVRAAPGGQQLLDWPYAVEQPIAPAVAAWGEAAARLAGLSDEALLATHPTAAPDVRQETDGAPGAADPETIVLRQQRGLRRARTVDTVVAGFVGAADGDLSTAQLLDALASLLGRSPTELRTEYLPLVRDLVAEGFLSLTGDSALP